MIANFDYNGNLPPGIHEATLEEVRVRFGINEHRINLVVGLQRALYSLKYAGCITVFLDGSFITSKQFPNDVDCLWDPVNVDPARLDKAFLWNAATEKQARQRQKFLFYGDYFPSSFTEGDSMIPFFEFFQIDRETGKRKGIIKINLEELP